MALENIIQIMKMHHEDAAQIKCSYVLDSIARSSIKNYRKAVANGVLFNM